MSDCKWCERLMREVETLRADTAAAEELGTCRVYRHGCADGRAIESLPDRWREYALPHPKRENCVEWVALAPSTAVSEMQPEDMNCSLCKQWVRLLEGREWDGESPILYDPCAQDEVVRLRAELAAAEERGRRRGRRERVDDELIQLLHGCQADLAPLTVQRNLTGDIARLVTAKLEAALAPRDSAPCPDPPPGTLEAAEASARRGGQVGCGNIATYQAPRDSAPEPDPTCPEDFEPPWPKDRP